MKAKIAFGNCGSDGNDAAVKFARAYTGRTKIITFINGYHGNTYGSCSMTTCTTRMHAKMGPFLPEIYHFPFYGEDVPDEIVEKEATKDIETAFRTYMPADEVAAVVIEAIQGDAGILPAHPIFLKKLYDLCKKHGILFIDEEVQQGFWRPATSLPSRTTPASFLTALSWANPSAPASPSVLSWPGQKSWTASLHRPISSP